jgi:hypothetical protein
LSLTVHDTTVVKGYARHFGAEVEKAHRMASLPSGDSFRVPAVLAVDEQRRSITYQRLALDRPLADVYVSALRASDFTPRDLLPFERVGAALADIHTNLPTDDCVPWEPSSVVWDVIQPSPRLDDDGMVALHCDYGFANIFFDRDTTVPQIIDPSPNFATTFHPLTVGPPYVDLGQLFSSLDGRVPVRRWIGLRWERVAVIKAAVCRGYSERSGVVADMVTANRYAYAASRCWFVHRYGRGLRTRLAMYCLYGKNRSQRDGGTV